jgi:low affinity Fe/Cu permease
MPGTGAEREDAAMHDHAAEDPKSRARLFSRAADRLTEATGSPAAAAAVLFAVWLAVGAGVGYPRWWELSATVGVPFLTLLMLVVIQHTQNHDDDATRLKLDELIRASSRATNRMITIEDASRGDLDEIRRDFREQAASDGDPGQRGRTGKCAALGMPD